MRNSDKCCNPHHGHPPASSRISNQHKILKNVVFYFSYRHAGSRPQVPLVHTFSLRLSSPGLFQSQGLPSFCTCSHTHSKSTDDEPACPCPHTHTLDISRLLIPDPGKCCVGWLAEFPQEGSAPVV